MGRREVPLNREGILQAKRVARMLSQLKLDAIYSSPLKRALQTARLLAGKNSIPIRVDPDLTEVAFGRWEGFRLEELIRNKVYQRFINAPLTAKVPGGETIRDVQRRALAATRRAAREFPRGNLLFVSHGDVIRAIICHCLRLPLQEFRRLKIDNGSLTALEVDGRWAEIKFMNYLPDITPANHEPFAGLKPAK